MAASLPILKIEGPPGSGKTRELAREVCRLIEAEGIAPEDVHVLCMSGWGKRRLREYLIQEARQAGFTAPPAIRIQTVDEFLLALIQHHEPDWALIPEPDARSLLHHISQTRIPVEHPLSYASRDPSFSRTLWELIRQLQLQQIEPRTVAEAGPGADGRLRLLMEIYGQFQERMNRSQLLCSAELVHKALALTAGQASSDYTGVVICIDDAQELSVAHHRLFAGLHARLILAGNDKLSIRSYRGAAPQIFTDPALYNRPVTPLPRLACMRHNETLLSLVNHLLPEPVWESHTPPDPDSLQSMARFATCLDPVQEADTVARSIRDWVESNMFDDRPASLDDCLILLRSGRYRSYLIQALLRHEIPFQAETPESRDEETLWLQHYVYDAACILESLTMLGMAPDRALDGHGLQSQLDALPLSTADQMAFRQRQNRHLKRFLEAELPDSTPLAIADDENLLLQLLLLESPSGTLRTALDTLAAWYRLLRSEAALEDWMDAVAAHLADRADIEKLAGFRQNLARLDHAYRKTLHRPLSIADLVQDYPDFWNGSDATPEDERSAVRLMSFHQAQGEEAALVCIPFMVSEELPHTRRVAEILSSEDLERLGVLPAYLIDAAEEKRLLAVGITRARQQVLLSCHLTDAGMPVLPSPFYETLRQLVHHTDMASPTDNLESTPAGRYLGRSAWAALQRQSAEPLFSPHEEAYLSASSIKTYMACPRQFYYRHMLRLPTPGSEAATLGTLIHKLMEVFNQQAMAGKPYMAMRLRELADCLFSYETDEAACLENGFDEKDILVLKRLNPLSRNGLKQRLLDSIDDLEAKGYFERYADFKRIEAEKTIDAVRLPGIDRLKISGSMDAVIQTADGHWEIIDYKTFKAYAAVGLDTCDKHFQSTLDPVPDAEGLSHGERFAAKLNPAYPKDYQLPLYYLGCNEDPKFRNQIKSVAVQVVRPQFSDNPNQGAIRLEMTAADIEVKKEQMLSDIRRYIVEPILEASAFEKNPGSVCGACGYYGICDADIGEDA